MNRLAAETSPYLLQHAENPVDWYPWGEEALARARGEDRPILLSIGYAACHWCHVMEHESFEDEATAAQMNEQFVCIKVDREERPDLDAIYMDAVVALTGHGGWPMTVFLTPEGEPFFGGTYYPPAPRHGLPSFRQVLDAVARAYRERREDIARERAAARRGGALLERGRAVERAADRLDPLRGGARAAPRLRPGARRLRRRAEVPARLRARAPPAARRARSRHGHARRDGGRRHVRPRRRRLPPLLGRRRLARAALREDALRQRAPRPRVPPRVGRHRRGAVSRRRRGDLRVPAPRPPAARGRLRVLAGRRHRRRRGADLHLDGGRGRARGAAAPVRARPLDHPRRARRRSCGRACSRSARAARSPAATTRRSPPGTGWPSPRSRRPGVACQVPLCYKRQRSSETSCSASFPRPTGGSSGPGGTGRRASPAFSRTTPTSPTASTSCTSRRASCAGSRRRTGSPGSRSTSSPTSGAAASS